jgi:hypothetical protein
MLHKMPLGSEGYRAVMRLAGDPSKAKQWLPVVVACYQEALRVAPLGGEFAGAWVLKALQRWVPNLRVLGSFGILEKSGSTTGGGRRAYYRLRDVGGVRRALSELHMLDERGGNV